MTATHLLRLMFDWVVQSDAEAVRRRRSRAPSFEVLVESAESTEGLPVRLRDDGRTATWNPAVTRAAHVMLHVERADHEIELRRSVNSGRARVRAGERIVKISPAER